MKSDEIVFSYDNLFLSPEPMRLPMGEVFQVCELSVAGNGEIAEHIQECDEVTYCVSGNAYVYSDDFESELYPGCVHYIKRGSRHRIKAGNDGIRFVGVGFIPDDSYGQLDSFAEAVGDARYIIAEENKDMRALTEMLVSEFYRSDKYSHNMINGYIVQILISFARSITVKKEEKIERAGLSASSFTLYNALRYIDREYMYIKSVKEASQKLSYSEYYLSHLFKERLGITIKEYILKKKVYAAAELLKNGNMNVTEMSEYFGFTSAHTFSQAFKRYFGMSPTRFKKENNSKF